MKASFDDTTEKIIVSSSRKDWWHLLTYVMLNPSVMIAASAYVADIEGFIWAGFLVCGILAFCVNFYSQTFRMTYQLILTHDGTLTCTRWITGREDVASIYELEISERTTGRTGWVIRLLAPSFIAVVQADDPDGRSLDLFRDALHLAHRQSAHENGAE